MSASECFLFYEDEDKILQMPLHQSDEQDYICACLDCQSLRIRMKQIELMQSSCNAGAA